jgi:hypothetical protein
MGVIRSIAANGSLYYDPWLTCFRNAWFGKRVNILTSSVSQNSRRSSKEIIGVLSSLKSTEPIEVVAWLMVLHKKACALFTTCLK